MSVFSRLRQWRRLLVLVACIWLPLGVYAQVCTTAMQAAAIGGSHHPGLPQPGEADFAAMTHGGHAAVVVVDADTFWRTLDSMDCSSDMKALCAFASLAAITADIVPAPPVPAPASVALPADASFATRDAAPDTPPPRPHL